MRWMTSIFMCMSWCGTVTTIALAEEPSPIAWRLHKLDPANINGAAAAVDINRDGRLDIIAGKFWYEAPDWKKHFVHDVEIIRGRNDDYSSLPLDVNADGWPDIVSVNYRSKSLYWIEHPGESLAGPWRKHVIDTPGPSETGRLADVDGDGQMDVLPNGTDFAAWYSYSAEKGNNGKGKPAWLRHELPKELVGHGIGFGDINGDGRGDLVGPNGWAEAPENRRTGRWIWHADFQLDRDAGIPIFVHDIDTDGDADLVWGRGHDYGIYWLENNSGDWKRHTIDESFSQAHSLLLTDINNDGRQDLVAGKRYFGHDGKDPGANDPMVIYWYSFDAKKHTWQRHLIHESKNVAFGLDPKATDVDADGDVDILCADRSGLYLLENLLVRNDDAKPQANEASALPPYDDHTNLSVVIDAKGKSQPVKTTADWQVRRGHVLQGMQRVMGPLPPRDRDLPLDMRTLKSEEADGYTRHTIRYRAEPGDLDPGNMVPAFLLVPDKIDGQAAAMLCLHPTSPLGKAQIAGLDGQPTRFYAHELAKRGYVCLVPDYPSFGEYHGYNFAKDDYISGTMKAIVDNIRGVDLLASLEYVDGDRIGVIGHSLGGHNALFTAAFDERIQAVVTSCGFTTFGDYYGGNLKGWTSDRYMPAIRDDFASDPRRVPFDFPEILAAIAPRPTFISAPLHDGNFDVSGVKKCVAAAGEIYGLHESQENLRAVYPDCAHDFPDEIRAAVYDWLDERLKCNR